MLGGLVVGPEVAAEGAEDVPGGALGNAVTPTAASISPGVAIAAVRVADRTNAREAHRRDVRDQLIGFPL